MFNRQSKNIRVPPVQIINALFVPIILKSLMQKRIHEYNMVGL